MELTGEDGREVCEADGDIIGVGEEICPILHHEMMHHQMGDAEE